MMPRSSFRFEAIGTLFEISTASPMTKEVCRNIVSLAVGFDNDFSRFKDSSLIAKIARKSGTYQIPEYSMELFEFYENLYKVTSGRVTPLVGESLNALGYDANYSLKATSTQPAQPFEKVVARNGTELVTFEPTTIDIGAAGKGFLVDRIAKLLEEFNHDEYTIDASGDIVHKGSEPERIGLEDPRNPGKVIGEIPLSNQALCASAVNRRAWGEGLHHIIDPQTGEPTKDIIATWVIAETTMLADGLATALFFTAPEILKEQYTYEYMRVHKGGRIDFSNAFKNTLY